MVDSRAEAQGQAQGGKEEKGDEYAGGAYSKLLRFLNDSNHYRPYRVMNKLSGDGAFRFSFFVLTTDDWGKKTEMPEARAILLGRMGKHEEALKIYVYRLQDYSAAESCVKKTIPHFFFLKWAHAPDTNKETKIGIALKIINRIIMSFSSFSNSISVPHLHHPRPLHPNPNPTRHPPPPPPTSHQPSPSSPNTPPPSPLHPSSTSSPHLSPSPTSTHSS